MRGDHDFFGFYLLESHKKNGVDLVIGIEEIEKIKTKKVMITAHGAADTTKKKLGEAGFFVYDASCPLVMRVHKTVKAMVQRDYFPVVIGQENHVEVKGIVGDLEHYGLQVPWAPVLGLKTRLTWPWIRTSVPT